MSMSILTSVNTILGYVVVKMNKTVLIFVPNTLNYLKGYVEGVHKSYEDCEAYYITNDIPVKNSGDNTIGSFSDSNKLKKDFNGIVIDVLTKRIDVISDGNFESNTIRINYNFEEFKSVDLSSEYKSGDHFKCLSENLKKRHCFEAKDCRRGLILTTLLFINTFLNRFSIFLNKYQKICSYSSTCSHFQDNLQSCHNFLTDVIETKHLTPKTGNFILSKSLNIILGVISLYYLLENEESILEFIETVRETTIKKFHDLLLYLMGSPIGLKLNDAFNASLGRFFFYHMSLWRIFLITMHPFLRDFYKCFLFLSVMGFSYQIAILSDLFSIATFHVYCIYVYASRLFYFQLKALSSLWRLFIGRKYNPLRSRVDSYQYSQHQLFIGTLGFTIFLFLLPTTTMYYTVFGIFRFAVLAVEEILKKMHCVLRLPIYGLLLYIWQSPQIKGPICLRVNKPFDESTFDVHLENLLLFEALRVGSN